MQNENLMHWKMTCYLITSQQMKIKAQIKCRLVYYRRCAWLLASIIMKTYTYGSINQNKVLRCVKQWCVILSSTNSMCSFHWPTIFISVTCSFIAYQSNLTSKWKLIYVKYFKCRLVACASGHEDEASFLTCYVQSKRKCKWNASTTAFYKFSSPGE